MHNRSETTISHVAIVNVMRLQDIPVFIAESTADELRTDSDDSNHANAAWVNTGILLVPVLCILYILLHPSRKHVVDEDDDHDVLLKH